jgi:glycerol-1-phosphate dehydrogenase [NAD(P)+]
VLGPTPVTRDDVLAHFGPDLGAACWRELEQKHFDRDQAAALSARLAASWDDMRARIRRIAIPAARLRALLADAGAPTTPAELGWPASLFADARLHAREIRNRYTFLDFAADLIPRA